MKSHPEEKRDKADEEANIKKNIFGHDPIDVYAKIHGKKRKGQKDPVVAPVRGRRGRRVAARGSDLSASDDDDDGRTRCRECTVMRNGFQCSSTQVHVGCFTCAKLIAQRDDADLKQSCPLCTNYFCNLYYPPCKPGVHLQLLKNRKDSVKIDSDLLRGNRHEFDVIRAFLVNKKMNSKEVFDFMMKEYLDKDKFSYIIDRKIQKNPPVVSR